MHMQTDKPHKKDVYLAFPLFFCLSISTNKMQLILCMRIWGTSAAGLLNLEARATWQKNCTTLLRDYSLDLTSGGKKKKERKKKFLVYKKFLHFGKSFISD